ncbi:hypothetical protein F0562_023067 [Nyssa sinensis]|uniref:Uncharacterized protein n=1 Tax=Nyssa sinensis TaxID=561372 RepID=A0A5J5BFL0_9ASTE|nr:hypothetical protein F0562_023067 [Nyssa sinensis]
MALRVPPTSTWQALPHTRTISTTPRVATNYIPSSTVHLHRSSPLFASKPIAWSGQCRATSPGPPPPPDSEPSAGEDPVPGVELKLCAKAGVQSRAKILFVLQINS